MHATEGHPRNQDEWRVEVRLEGDADGHSLGERLRSVSLDDEARERLGSDVVVTKDGPHLFAYAWHEQSAREAERVIRDLLEEDGLAGVVELERWHPEADEWRPASEPLPTNAEEAAAERERHAAEAAKEAEQSGTYDWQVVLHFPGGHEAGEWAKRLIDRGLPTKRRFRHVLVGVTTEEAAIELGKELEAEVPKGTTVGLRGDPNTISLPGFVLLSGH